MPPSQNFVVVQNWPFGKKNQPPSPEKTPRLSEKSKTGILLLFGHGRPLDEKAIDEYNDSCSTVFNSYDIYTTQDICQTPLDNIQTPPDTIQTLSRHP